MGFEVETRSKPTALLPRRDYLQKPLDVGRLGKLLTIVIEAMRRP